MTTRERTGLLSVGKLQHLRPISEQLFTVAFGAIQWPWLLRSLWGGTQADKRALIARLGLAPDALPNLGSWKADTTFLHRLVDVIERTRPQVVVELGCGATSLVIARALQLHGGGKLYGFDQNADFVEHTSAWLEQHQVEAELRPAPIAPDPSEWSSLWYSLPVVPAPIDLLVIDGPPWALNPLIRGRAEVLFESLAPGAFLLLDDAARPGERLVARRWRRKWPDIRFAFLGGGKGLLVGRKRRARA